GVSGLSIEDTGNLSLDGLLEVDGNIKQTVAGTYLYNSGGDLQTADNFVPTTTNAYYLGADSNRWSATHTTSLCLSGDCRSAWPGGVTYNFLSPLTESAGNVDINIDNQGLIDSGGTLVVNANPTEGTMVDNSGVRLIDCADGEVLQTNASGDWVCSTGGGGDSEWTDGGTYVYPTDAGNYGVSGMRIEDAGNVLLDGLLTIDGNLRMTNSTGYIYNNGVNVTVADNFIPNTNGGYTLGSDTKRWSYTHTNELCLSGDCRSVWPGGAGADSDWLYNGTHIYKGNTGNVGIGTNTPDKLLDVEGSSGWPGIALTSNGAASGSKIWWKRDGAWKWSIGTDTSDNFIIGNEVTGSQKLKMEGGDVIIKLGN
ncbi:MAG: hypothetical protein ABIB97_06275, partial [Patescibacteria group bacterium]